MSCAGSVGRLVVVAGALASIACSSRETKGSSGTGTDSLVIGAGGDEFGLKLNRGRLGRYPLNAGICEPMVRLTSDFNITPWLANGWEYRGDNTYRFSLRTDARFHNGSPLTAASVRYTLDQGIRE